MQKNLRALIIEDNEDDAILLINELTEGGFDLEWERVETPETFKEAIKSKTWDCIICDYKLPHFSGLEALSEYKRTDLDIPFIIVSGKIGEETAVEAMVAGAHDYIMKDRMKRLSPALRRELADAELRRRNKQVMNELHQSEEQFRNIYQNSPIAIEIYDQNGVLIDINPSCCDLFGVESSNSVKGFKLFDDPNIDPYYRDLLMKGHSFRYESDFDFDLVRKLGLYPTTRNGKIALDILITPISGNDRSLKYLVQITDNTERKEAVEKLKSSEEKFRSLFENSPVGISVTGVEGSMYINKSFSDLVGYSEDEIRLMKWDEITHPDDVQLSIDAMQSLLDKKAPKVRFEKRYIHKNGNFVYTDISIFLQSDDRFNPKYFITVVSDITKAKLAELDLIATKEKAEENNRLKTALLKNLSHEIRTPMNAIMGFSELMKEAGTNEKDQYAEIISGCSNQLLTLIDDVILLSRLQSEKLKLNETSFKPADLIKQVLQSYRLSNLNNEVEVFSKISDDYLNLVIHADKDKIVQILNTLFSNAIKYTFHGSVKIGFEIENGYALFFVEDTGIGIPKFELERIFSTFYRGEQAISLAIRGTGLGLNIAKLTAEQLDGKIIVKSILNEGSRFSLMIPLKIADQKEPDPDILQKSNNQVKDSAILIVDDEITNIQYLEILLKGTFKMIDSAVNGQEAIEKVSNGNYTMVLMDIKMPVMDGIEATKILKETYPNLPIIAQTAYTSSEDKELTVKAGCDDFLAKPISKARLMEIINKHV